MSFVDLLFFFNRENVAQIFEYIYIFSRSERFQFKSLLLGEVPTGTIWTQGVARWPFGVIRTLGFSRPFSIMFRSKWNKYIQKKNGIGKYKYILAVRGQRKLDLLGQKMLVSGSWVTGHSWKAQHTRRFRNLYSISPVVEIQTIPLASHFFWLTCHVKLINTNLSPNAGRGGEMECQVQ